MAGILFSGNAGGRGIFKIAPAPVLIAAFGNPSVDLLSFLIPQRLGNRAIIRGQLFFNLGAGGMDLSLSSSGFFNGTVLIDSAGGGTTGPLVGQYPTTFVCPGAAFNGLTVVNYYLVANDPQPPGDISFIWRAVENTAGIPGEMFAGSYIEIIYF